MAQLIVIVNKLNKRRGIPSSFSDKTNIVSTVAKGFSFEGYEAAQANPALGKWYIDSNNYYYWGGGLQVLDVPLGITINIPDLPANLPHPFRAGIDVSHYKILHDWNAIKNAGVTFCYIKISEGVGTPDLTAKDHAAAARQRQLKIGYYHFCRPDTRNGGTIESDATAEANEALERMKSLPPPDLPLTLDLENEKSWDTTLNKKDYLLWIKIFLRTIREQGGKECMIYSRTEYLNRKLPADHDLGTVKLWISRYTIKDCNKLELPVGWTDWSIWQYVGDKGVIGDNDGLDINILKDQTLF